MSAQQEGPGIAVSAWIPLLRRAHLKTSVKVVGFALASYADLPDGAEARPGTARLAVDCGLNTDTVKTALKALRLGGFVCVLQAGSRGRGTVYALTRPTEMRSREAYEERVAEISGGLNKRYPGGSDLPGSEPIPGEYTYRDEEIPGGLTYRDEHLPGSGKNAGQAASDGDPGWLHTPPPTGAASEQPTTVAPSWPEVVELPFADAQGYEKETMKIIIPSSLAPERSERGSPITTARKAPTRAPEGDGDFWKRLEQKAQPQGRARAPMPQPLVGQGKHRFEDEGYNVCAHCQLPESNQVHRGAA